MLIDLWPVSLLDILAVIYFFRLELAPQRFNDEMLSLQEVATATVDLNDVRTYRNLVRSRNLQVTCQYSIFPSHSERFGVQW